LIHFYKSITDTKMKSLLPLLLFSLTLFELTKAEGEEEGKVLVLTKKNFDKAIKGHHLILVEFYAPWCGHCQDLAPKYEEAAKLLVGTGVKLAKIDATAETELASKYEIEGYPTLKLFRDEKVSDYTGPMDAKGIVMWMEKKAGPQYTMVNSVKEVKLILETDQKAVVGFFPTMERKDAQTFIEVAGSNDDVKFLVCSKADNLGKYKQDEGKISVITQFDEEKQSIFEGSLTYDNLAAFVAKSITPLVWEFTDSNADKIFSSSIQDHFILLAKEDDKKFSAMLNMEKTVAKEYKDKMVFIHLNCANNDHEGVLDYLGLTKDSCPTFTIYNINSGSKFLPESDKAKDISETNIRKFVKDYFDGNLKKFLKSQALPEDWDAGDVKTLVNSNFDEIAKDKTKDVFIMFYAPWCGHCKAMAPTWDELGKKYSAKKDLVIAKVDATENEIDGFDIEGFPTIKMVKKESNEIEDYYGKKDIESFVKYIEKGEQEEPEDEDEDEDEENDDLDDKVDDTEFDDHEIEDDPGHDEL